MKTASVRDLRQNFPRVMAWIEDGEEVAVTLRRKVIARLVPEREASPAKPDFKARFGKPVADCGTLAESAVTLLCEERGS